MSSIRLNLTLLEPGQENPEADHNEAIQALDIIVGMTLKQLNLNDPPASPAAGDTYVIGPSPTGVWVGNAGNIAYFDNGWKYIPAKDGMSATLESDNSFRVRVAGNWVQLETSVSSSLPAGGTAGQVLAKASNSDYDVEWVAVAGGTDFLTLSPVTTATYNFVIADFANKTKRLDTGSSGSNGNMVLNFPDALASGLSNSQERICILWKSSASNRVSFTTQGAIALRFMKGPTPLDLQYINDVYAHVVVKVGKNESGSAYAHITGWLDET